MAVVDCFGKGSASKVVEVEGGVGFGVNTELPAEVPFPFLLKGLELWNSVDMVCRVGESRSWFVGG